MKSPHSTACADSGERAFTEVRERVTTKAKCLRLGQWKRVALTVQQRVTDTDLAAAIGVSRPLINAWRDEEKSTLPNAAQLAAMPLEAALPWLEEICRVLTARGYPLHVVDEAAAARVVEMAPALAQQVENLRALVAKMCGGGE